MLRAVIAVSLSVIFAGSVAAGEQKEAAKKLPACCRKVRKDDLAAARQRSVPGLALQLSPQAEDDKECDRKPTGSQHKCACSKPCKPGQRAEDPKCTKHCKPNLCKCAPNCKDAT